MIGAPLLRYGARVRSDRRARHAARAARSELSAAADALHREAVLISIEEGRPGLITDDYLARLPTTTGGAVAELSADGTWQPTADGYRVPEDVTMQVVGEAYERLAASPRQCEISGTHLADPRNPGRCSRCLLELP